MAGAAHAPVGWAAIVRRELRAVGAAQGGGQGAQAQLLHRVREEADRAIALQAVLAQLRAVPAAQASRLRPPLRQPPLTALEVQAWELWQPGTQCSRCLEPQHYPDSEKPLQCLERRAIHQSFLPGLTDLTLTCATSILQCFQNRGQEKAGVSVLQREEVLTCQGAASSQIRHVRRDTHRHACRYPAPRMLLLQNRLLQLLSVDCLGREGHSNQNGIC